MISTVSLLYDLDSKLNKVATTTDAYIANEDKILALNDAQIRLIKDKVGPDRIYGLGLDGFKKKYEDLESLIQPHLPFNLTKDKVGKLNKYLLDLKGITPKFMFYIDSYFVCDKAKCKDRIIATNKVKHADIHKVLANSNTSPSFEYQECPITITDRYLEFYTDGSFEPKKGYLSFLRYPKEMDIEGYIKQDGSASKTIDCELNDYLADELLNYAALSLAINTANQNVIQGTQLINQNNE